MIHVNLYFPETSRPLMFQILKLSRRFKDLWEPLLLYDDLASCAELVFLKLMLIFVWRLPENHILHLLTSLMNSHWAREKRERS